MATAAFIILEDLGAGPVRKFCWTEEVLTQADGIRSGVVRRMVRERLDRTDYAPVHLATPKIEELRDNLDLYRDFVGASPVHTSFGPVIRSDMPSILYAISILDPIIAAARGEVVELREVA